MHRISNSKRRKFEDKKPVKNGREQQKMQWQDEEISSEEDYEGQDPAESEDDSDDLEESAESKRLRLAKQYLSHMKADNDESVDGSEEEEHTAMVSSKLKATRMRSKGELFEDFVPFFSNIDAESCTRRDLSGHQGTVTCVALTKDECSVVSGSKDNSVIKWDVETGSKCELRPRWNKESEFQSCKGEVLSVAVTHDGRYIASGGRDNSVRIYDSRQKYSEIKELKGHRDAVTSLCFRMDSYTLFSGSLDRCIKHWDINEMAYIETMFGHQDGINSLDCWTKEKPLSASSDRSVRLWKVAEETHLVFRGHKSNIDCVQYLTDTSFVSAGQDGALHLWKDAQKVPVRSVPAAHGLSAHGGGATWVSSLATVKMSNIVATGSMDGFVRLWSASAEDRQMSRVCEFEMPGCINALAITPRLLVAGCGKEHKYGRWFNMKGSLNKLRLIRFDSLLAEQENDEDDDSSDNSSSMGSGHDSSASCSGESDDDDDDVSN
eukprot:CAMPEP_0170402294 /NCGR_PEP_ID=MMETSP0117_2-20130122/25482_1 /TAXON_ID=400756 /ORGANISM="Durinskia baltica, Strain CSIRO CS-38" /LENGTH=491 /DNA_ID=CAMNT_0010659155 /DNA_START=52 /DNA_END=1527 /DNA_ORIENTATION=+